VLVRARARRRRRRRCRSGRDGGRTHSPSARGGRPHP